MPLTTRTRNASWVPFALVVTGCNLGPADCDFFRIEARMVGTVERSGQTTPTELVQDAYAFQSYLFPNLQRDFEVARAFLVEGRVAAAGSLGWTVSKSPTAALPRCGSDSYCRRPAALGSRCRWAPAHFWFTGSHGHPHRQSPTSRSALTISLPPSKPAHCNRHNDNSRDSAAPLRDGRARDR
jgi:hypothetical protein